MKFYDVVMRVFEYYADNGRVKQLTYNDRALRLLFEMYPKEISELMDGCLPDDNFDEDEDDIEPMTTYESICGYFCKSFRQQDIIDYKKGSMDMVFWHLINGSDILDKVFKSASEWHDLVKSGQTPEKAFEYIIDEYL